MELYLKHRPKAFKTVVGQPDAVRVLHQMVRDERVPHALLLTGPSGCGKTTLARILVSKLDCSAGDFQEINAADFRGIDTVREIRTRMTLSPIHGKCRIWVIDEAHKLSNDAQNALLKALEDTPKHVYFILATTDPAKLIKTILTRCTEVKLREMAMSSLQELIKDIADQEKIKLSDEVTEKIIECSMGSARYALVLLNKIVGLDESEQLDTIEKAGVQTESIALARALLNHAPWVEVAKILKTMPDEPESTRYLVLGYMSQVILGGGKMAPRAAEVIERFQFNFYDSKRAGLILACHSVSGR
jgi:DNA polymerase III gamma/tau subunit